MTYKLSDVKILLLLRNFLSWDKVSAFLNSFLNFSKKIFQRSFENAHSFLGNKIFLIPS